MKPLDRGLNTAVLTIANRLFPTGFDVSEEAPSTYRQLVNRLDAGYRMVVYKGGSEHTIYGDDEVNWSFRAWHDWCHWRGGHDFSVQGEKAVWQMMCEHITKLYGTSPSTDRWKRILYAEVVGQRLYYVNHHTYAEDQVAFTQAYLTHQHAV